MKDKILLFIPAYNCEKQIIRVLGQLGKEIMYYITKVIVVNNLSTDNTEEVVSSFIKKHPEIPVKLLRNQENYGLGGSHKVAFSYAKENQYDYVMVLHGDDQGEIHDFLPVLRSGFYKKHECVLGARFMRGSKLKGYSTFRTFGNIVYDFLFAAVIRKRVFDLGSGLNLYKVSMFDECYYKKFPDNLMFNYCMMLATNYYKQDMVFYPISWREDDQVSNVKMFNQALSVLRMLKDYCFNPDSLILDYREKDIKEYKADEIA